MMHADALCQQFQLCALPWLLTRPRDRFIFDFGTPPIHLLDKVHVRSSSARDFPTSRNIVEIQPTIYQPIRLFAP